MKARQFLPFAIFFGLAAACDSVAYEGEGCENGNPVSLATVHCAAGLVCDEQAGFTCQREPPSSPSSPYSSYPNPRPPADTSAGEADAGADSSVETDAGAAMDDDAAASSDATTD
jgi:hypothetical protein